MHWKLLWTNTVGCFSPAEIWAFLASRQKSGRTVRGAIEPEQRVQSSAKERTSVHLALLTFFGPCFSLWRTSDSRRWVIPCLCFARAYCDVRRIATKNPWWGGLPHRSHTPGFGFGAAVRWLAAAAAHRQRLCTVLMMLSARWGVGMRKDGGGGVHGGENWGREGLLLISTAPQHFS